MSLSLAVPSRIAAGLGWPRSVRWSSSLGWPGDLAVPRETALLEGSSQPGPTSDEPGTEERADAAEPEPSPAEDPELSRAEGPELTPVDHLVSAPQSGSPGVAETGSPSPETSVEHQDSAPGPSLESNWHEDDGLHPLATAPVEAADSEPDNPVTIDATAIELPAPDAVPRETRRPGEPGDVLPVASDLPSSAEASPVPDARHAPQADVSRETDTSVAPEAASTDTSVARPPGPRRAKFDRDEFDDGEVAETPTPDPVRPPPPGSTTSSPRHAPRACSWSRTRRVAWERPPHR